MGVAARPNWGRTQPAATNTAQQLARIQRPEPCDIVAYLYGWDTPNHTNNVLGRYKVTYGAGGTSTQETIEVPARGLVLHYVTAVVEIDTLENQSPPLQSISKAHLGLGRPTDWQQYTQGSAVATTAGATIQIPQWTTSVRVLGQFASALGPAPIPSLPVTTGLIEVAGANDPTFASPATYRIADLFDGFVPLSINSGYVRLFGGADTFSATILFAGIR